MNERVKLVRKSLGLTLQKFGEHLGLSHSALSNIENGKRSVSEQLFLSICREFNVNEDWLRTGEGEMFNQLSEDEELAEVVGRVLAGEDDFIKSVYLALGKADPKFIKMLEEFVNDIYKNLHD